MLVYERRRLEQILSKTKESEKVAPQGYLRVSTNRKWAQFYHWFPGDRTKGKYIPRENHELIRGLAQKTYDEKVIRLVSKRLSQINKILKDYKDEELDEIYLNEHIERRKLIKPAEPVWEEQISEWLHREYKGKEFREGSPVIMTERGERVRSKSEKILADYFARNKIPYKYECPLYLNGSGTVHPDFTFLSPKTGQEIYWEHNGMMDDPSYAQNAVRKIHAYEENGIYPGERLILTFETEKTVLDMKLAERLARRYLI